MRVGSVPVSANSFQPSPDPKAGCDQELHLDTPFAIGEFQPSPDPKAGCDPELAAKLDGMF